MKKVSGEKKTSNRKSKRQEKNINDTGTVHIIHFSQLFKSIEGNGTWLTGVKLTDQHNIGDEK